jgi:tetratricopeptide (TPR) repeat protein
MPLSVAHDALDRARRSLAQGSFRQVLALCRPILSGLPHDPEVCSLVAAAFLGVGRAFKALQVIAPVCGLNPERADLQAVLASCFLDGGKFELARRSAERALRLAPDDSKLVGVVREADARIAQLERLVGSATRSLFDENQGPALRRDFRSSYRAVPIIINSRDRRSCLEQLVVWLRSAGYLNIGILDNQSTYPPLLDYLRGIENEVSVFHSPRNLGPRALWSSGLIGLVSHVPFVYTDPDMLPVDECPRDAVLMLFELLAAHRQATKAGLGIRIDDIPDTYEHKSAVQAWEANFWRRPLPGNCYDAAVDTTFALYRPGSWHNLRAVRSASPYLVRHLPWYADSSTPTPEDRYYAEHARSEMSSWGGKAIADLYAGHASRGPDDDSA